MMRTGLWVAMAAALAMAGCGKPDSGKQALATVGGDQITKAQVDTELKAAGAPQAENPEVRQAALEQIVRRKLLAQAARQEKLDQTPEMKVMRTAAQETFEAGLELGAIRAKIAQPTPQEAEAFVQSHPDMFAQRTGYLLDQLHVKGQLDPALSKALEPANTLAEVERVLQGRSLQFGRSVEQLDTLRANPQLTAAIRKLTPGQPFILPDIGGFTVSTVRQSSVQPVVGPQASAIANRLLLAEREVKAINDRLAGLKTDKVKYPKAATAK